MFLQVNGTGKFFSERLIGYEAGYRSLLNPHFYIDVAAFRNGYYDLYGYGTPGVLVQLEPPPPRLLLTVPVSNEVKGTTVGFEVAPNWQVTHWWQLKGSSSYLHLNLESKTANPNAVEVLNVLSDEGSSPHHQVVVQSLFNLPKRFEFDQTYRYVSSLPYLKIPAYEEADLRLGWHPTSLLELSIGGQNLLQPHHVESIGDPGLPVEIERSAYGKIMFRW